jgi:hypothetical protein
VKKSLLAVAFAATAALIAPACSTVAPDAARVGNTHIRITDFEKRLADFDDLEAFAEAFKGPGTTTKTLAQSLLSLEINNVLAQQLLAERGATLTAEEITAGEAAAKQRLGQDEAAGDAAWANLESGSRKTLSTFFAAQTKLSETIQARLTEEEITAHYEAAGAGAPPLEEVREQVVGSLTSKRITEAITSAALAADVRVDPRYGTFYPETVSFTSPEEAAAQQQAQNG